MSSFLKRCPSSLALPKIASVSGCEGLSTGEPSAFSLEMDIVSDDHARLCLEFQK
jgi:hypothetical protein